MQQVGSRRPLAEAMHRIDLAYLRRKAPITAGRIAKINCTRGDGTEVEATVSFAEVSARFGGRRVWFLCPCCQRPCSVLYASWRIACRRCHGLRYRSQSEGETARATSGMFKVIKRLDPRATDNKLPPKPKGMHWRSYQRLADRYHSYGTKWAVAVARRFRIGT